MGADSFVYVHGNSRDGSGRLGADHTGEEVTPEIEVREDGATICNGKIRAEINLIGKIAFYNQKGELLLDEYVRNRKDMFGNTCSSLEVEAREFKPITGGGLQTDNAFLFPHRRRNIWYGPVSAAIP